MNAQQEGKLIQQRAAGVAAEQELKVLEGAFAKTREHYTDAWLKTDPRDAAGREKLWVATTIVSQVERHIRQVIFDGKLAAKELDQIRKAAEPRRKVFGVALP